MSCVSIRCSSSRPKRRREATGMIQALQKTPGVQHAKLFCDEGHAYWFVIPEISIFLSFF